MYVYIMYTQLILQTSSQYKLTKIAAGQSVAVYL